WPVKSSPRENAAGAALVLPGDAPRLPGRGAAAGVRDRGAGVAAAAPVGADAGRGGHAVPGVGLAGDAAQAVGLRPGADLAGAPAGRVAGRGARVLRRDPGGGHPDAGGGADMGGPAMSYPARPLPAVGLAVLADVAVLRPRLLGRSEFWIAYAIVLVFQLL